jgi:hypothetical protein
MKIIIGIGLLIMSIGIISLIVQVIILLYKKIFNPKALKTPIERYFNDNQLLFVKEIERMHSDNESKMIMTGDIEIYQNLTGESLKKDDDYLKFLSLSGWENADTKSDLYKCGNYISELMMDLNRRFVYERLKLESKSDSEVLKEYSLNIKENEELLYKVSNVVDLFEEKERIKSISYTGISTNFRSGALRYKIGNLKPIPHRENYWHGFDRCKLFMLRNKMVFVGTVNKKNKIIK